IQLANATPSGSLRNVSAVNVVRLLVAPVLALPVALLLGLSGDIARVVVLESSMPVAVTTLLFTIEFDGDVDYVATAVLTTTLISIFTLTLLIFVLQSGIII
ncbi:MAG: AEC family transporter, partial [Halobacteria archaeon]|nr:AEC family transporter [Halobacteria archaeon]